MKRVLFLYNSGASGHHQATRALQKSFSKLYSDVDTISVNSAKYAYPKLRKLMVELYLQIIKRTPQIWDIVYDNEDIADSIGDLRTVFNRAHFKKVDKLLSEYKPDAVVCTHAAPCHVMAAYKEEKKKDFPLIAVATDLHIHTYWVHNKVDMYVVHTEEAGDFLKKKHIKKDKIKVFGIPIDDRFGDNGDKQKARERLGIHPDMFTILIAGGSRGFVSTRNIVNSLKKSRRKFQAIIVTGYKRSLNGVLSKVPRRLKFPSRVFSYTKNMDGLMSASDIIISKPGGLTVAEAMSKGLPIMIVQPLPGQEQINSRFLIKNGVGIKISKTEKIHRSVDEIISHPHKLAIMRNKALHFSKPDSSAATAKEIYSFINGSAGSGDKG